MASFTHLDKKGRVRMVDVTPKAATLRTAEAWGRIFMKAETLSMIADDRVKKGNVIETARIAGIMAAKKTSDLIPMCHPLSLTHIVVDFFPDSETSSIEIRSLVKVLDRTGVEMEALTAVAVAALTIYDMCKSHDRSMRISDIRLMEKSGGKSGTYKRKAEDR